MMLFLDEVLGLMGNISYKTAYIASITKAGAIAAQHSGHRLASPQLWDLHCLLRRRMLSGLAKLGARLNGGLKFEASRSVIIACQIGPSRDRKCKTANEDAWSFPHATS